MLTVASSVQYKKYRRVNLTTMIPDNQEIVIFKVASWMNFFHFHFDIHMYHIYLSVYIFTNPFTWVGWDTRSTF